MNDRMAIRAQYNQVFHRVTGSVAVFVVYPQNLWKFIVITLFALFNKPSAIEHFSDTSYIARNCFSATLNSAFIRTVGSFMGRRTTERFFAMLARFFNCAFEVLGFIITFPRTIFCFSFTGSDIFKRFTTYQTISLELFKSRNSSAPAGAKFSCFQSIFRNIKGFSTYSTRDDFSSFLSTHNGSLQCH